MREECLLVKVFQLTGESVPEDLKINLPEKVCQYTGKSVPFNREKKSFVGSIPTGLTHNLCLLCSVVSTMKLAYLQ